MNSSDFEDFVTTSPKKKTMRRQYLVTHSKANMTKFSSRESFAEVPVNLFFLSGKVTVRLWMFRGFEIFSRGYFVCSNSWV